MIELEEHRALARLQLVIELLHHLAGPVVAFDEAAAFVVGGVAAEGTGDIGAGRAVVVLDQRIDLVALEVREARAGVIGHGIAVAGIGGVLVGAVEIARGRQAEPAGRAHAQDHRLGADHQEFGRARVDADRAGDAAVLAGQQTRRHEAVGDQHALAAKLAIERLLDGVAVRHRQHIGADVVHLLDVVIAVLVLLEADAEAIELLDDPVAVLRVLVDRGLVDDAVVGDGDFLGVLLRRGVARDDGVVEPVHAHRDGARTFHVRLLEQDDVGFRILLACADRGHRPGRAAADHQHIALDLGYAAANFVHRRRPS